jgi:hypothetical protein
MGRASPGGTLQSSVIVTEWLGSCAAGTGIGFRAGREHDACHARGFRFDVETGTNLRAAFAYPRTGGDDPRDFGGVSCSPRRQRVAILRNWRSFNEMSDSSEQGRLGTTGALGGAPSV